MLRTEKFFFGSHGAVTDNETCLRCGPRPVCMLVLRSHSIRTYPMEGAAKIYWFDKLQLPLDALAIDLTAHDCSVYASSF